MARSGGGWPQDAPGQQRTMEYQYYQNHPAFRSQQNQGPQIPRQHETAPLPPATSLFASSASSSSTPAFSSPPSYHHHHSHHYVPTSPLSRDPPYGSSQPPRPYGGDYATPASPVNQTAPPYPRWFDFRRSPEPCLAASERSENVSSAEASRAYGAANQHSGSGKSVVRPPSMPMHFNQPARPQPARDEARPPPIKGGLMGKLIPATYSPNGRHPRIAPPPPPVPSVGTGAAPPQMQLLQHSPTTGSRQSNPSSPQHPQQQQQQQQQHGIDRFPQIIPYQHEQPQRRPSRQQYSASPPVDYTFRHGKQPRIDKSRSGSSSSSSSSSVSPRQEMKQMSIHNLLSNSGDQDDNSNNTARASTASLASPRSILSAAMPSPSPSFSTSEYQLCVRQQPVAARSCGFGERDRRVIDPPPIVQMTIDDPTATPSQMQQRLRHPFSVVHCSIYNETGEEDNSAMPEDYRQQRRLMGTLVASPFVGKDENGEDGCFFCFPDLSCRTPGSFRLKFSLVVINPADMRQGLRTPIAATVMSDVLVVYNAKDFPGMQASTPLTRKLKEQGCLISIKKGNEKGGSGGGGGGGGNGGANGSRDQYSDDEYDDDGDGGCGRTGKRKRMRRS
ncbi:hypothetical protein PpBr36_09022 [Pyricularia pennisetigena]|uniref:hypothetical protein n=1 Tax=Pyricularia pennisetigena TaxID=1578925 RepID=UPI00114E7A70|nr:hypothetical protein PpBr36_09022 [Pyricularia pennisetigena]TLS24437.1 hypothetical protein PpBr36_09022 [Pyricularia pennisetigena]